MRDFSYKYVTSADIWKEFIPASGLVLIDKDRTKDKLGNIILSDAVVKRGQQCSESGTIIKVSPIYPQDSHEVFLTELWEPGDWVTFNVSTPFPAPRPPFYIIDNGKNENNTPIEDGSILIHISDITGVYHDSEISRETFEMRLKRLTEKHWRLQ